ncbi:MAG: PAS domain S-box protein [Dehalococcoidia bacterium]|nr:PAS domain S-box protein [Dehalococcoidia bacterium]
MELFELHPALDALPTMVYVKDRNLNIVSANKAFCDNFGVTLDQVIGTSSEELLGELGPESARVDREVINSSSPRLGITETYNGPDGLRFVLTDKAPILDDHGKAVGLIGTSIDITSQKHEQNDLVIRDRLLDLATDCIIVHDPQGNILYFNEATAISRGYTRDELAHATLHDLEAPDQAQRWEEIGTTLRRDGHARFELLTFRKDGSQFPIEVRATRMMLDNRPLILSVARDISERVKSEQELRQSEQRLRLVTDNIADIFWTMDLNFNTTYVSPSMERVLGFSLEERMRQGLQDMVTPESAATIMDALKQELHRETLGDADPARALTVEVEYYHKNGSTVWTENIVKGLRDNTGTLVGMVGVARDITERKHSDEELRLRGMLLDNANDAIYLINDEGQILYANEAASAMTGFSRDALLSMTVKDLNAPDFADQVPARISAMIEHGEFSFETRHRRSDGSPIDVAVRAKTFESDGGPLFVSVVRDITDTKRMELELRASEEKYRALVNSINDVVYALDADGVVTFISPQVEALSGIRAEDIVGRRFTEFVHPEDLPSIAQSWERLVLGIMEPSDFRVSDAEGRVRHVRSSSRPLFENGVFMGATCSLVEITARVEAEQSLQNSERKYRELFEQSLDAVSLAAPDGRVIEANPAWFRLFGYAPEDIAHLNARDMYAVPTDRDTFLSNISMQGYLKDDEVPMKTKDGRSLHILRSVIARHAPDGEIIGYQTVFRDITHSKAAEQALRESEEKYRELFEQSVDAVNLVTPDGRLLEANPAWFRLFGYTPEDISSYTASDAYVEPDGRARFLQAIASQDHVEDESKFRRKDGTIFDCHRIVTVRRSPDGGIIGFQTVFHDITESKAAERALREREQQYRQLFDQSIAPICLITVDGNLIEANDAWFNLLGYSREDTASFNAANLFPSPEMRPDFVQLLLRNGSLDNYESPVKTKDGRLIDIVRSISVRYHADGSILGFQTVMRDISEQKKAERQRIESAKRFHTLFNLSRDATYLMSPDGRLTEVNQAWLDLFGYTRDDVNQLNLFNLFADGTEAGAPIFAELENRGMVTGADVRLLKRDGTTMECICDMVLHQVEDGQVVAIQGATRDVTEQRRAERALRESEARFRTLSENLDDTVARLDRDCRMLYVNPALDRLSGVPHQDMVGRCLSDFSGLSQETLNATRDAIMHVFASGRPLSGSMDVQTHGGQRSIDWHMSPERDDDGVIQTVLMHLHDITDLRQTQEKLRLAGERLRELSGHLQDAREQERTALARDLHDNIGQGLTALKFDLMSLKKQLRQEADREDAISKVDNVAAMVDSLALDVRHLSTELRPGMLDDLGLCAAIEWQVGSFVERTGIQCGLSLPENDEQIPPNIAIVLYRVLQELLTNIARHSKATAARASLSMNEDSVTLEIADNGVGISSGGVETPHSFGILGIRERLRPINGRFTISGKRHKGTVAAVHVPLARRGEKP